MTAIGKRYLVHIRIGSGKPPLHRIKQAAAGVKEVLESLTVGTGNCKLAYTTQDGSSFGYFIKTNRHAGAIRAQLECPGNPDNHLLENPKPHIPPPLLGEDSILVIEIGEDFSGNGFSKAWTWLQHH